MFLSLPQSAHYESNKTIWHHAKEVKHKQNKNTSILYGNTLKLKIP